MWEEYVQGSLVVEWRFASSLIRQFSSMNIIQCSQALLAKDLTGKTILITGGYAGIGFAAAKQLASQGAHLILAGRSRMKGASMANEIGARFMELDLLDSDSINQFSKAFLSEYSALDVLICNAAISAPGAPDTNSASRRSKEGWEAQMAINHLGHARLIQFLKPILQSTVNSRVVIVSSCAADSMPYAGQPNQADVDLTDPHWKRRAYNDMDAYGQSKLAQLLYAFELAEQWKEEGVRVVALHPGWGDSELFRSAPEGAIDRDAWRQLGMLSLEDAAQVHLHCALSEEIENGKFYSQIGVYGNPSMQGGGLPMEFVSPNFTLEKQKAVWAWTQSEIE
jgi:NAD(P)-dependent dehydrogenase (short-subunit alcohol dehydrogenase family)